MPIFPTLVESEKLLGKWNQPVVSSFAIQSCAVKGLHILTAFFLLTLRWLSFLPFPYNHFRLLLEIYIIGYFFSELHGITLMTFKILTIASTEWTFHIIPHVLGCCEILADIDLLVTLISCFKDYAHKNGNYGLTKYKLKKEREKKERSSWRK